jgi:hypothetical protein
MYYTISRSTIYNITLKIDDNDEKDLYYILSKTIRVHFLEELYY